MTRQPSRPALAGVLLAFALAGSREAAAGEARPPRVVVVRAAVIHAGDGQVFRPGELLVENGVLKAIGTTVTAPDSAERRDLGDAFVTPHLVDPLVLVGTARGETGRNEAALLSAADARPIHDPLLTELRRRGIGALGLVPEGGAGPLGRKAASSTHAAKESGAPLLREECALVFSLPEGITGSASRAAARLSVSLALEEAEIARRKEQDKKKDPAPRRGRIVSRDRPGGPSPAASVAKEPPQPARDVMLRVVDKKLPLHVGLSRSDDALAMLALAQERGIDVILAGCRGCTDVAPEIGRSQALVILDPLHEPAFERNGLASDPRLVRRLLDEGARVAVTGGGSFPEGPFALRAAAGWMQAAGATEDEAVAAMSGRAAEAAGIADKILLRPGSPARFLSWSASPLDPSARVETFHEPADFEPAAEAAAAPEPNP